MKIKSLTKLEKIQLYTMLNRRWIIDTILDAEPNDFKESNGFTLKRADKLFDRLLDVLNK
jgi:hypothetical protein